MVCRAVWSLVCEEALGLSFLLSTSVCHPSPRIGVSTVRPGAGIEANSSSVEPAKALVRGPPLSRLPSFQVQLGAYQSPVGESANDAWRGPRYRIGGVDEDKTQVGGGHMAESQPGAQKESALHWLDTRGSILATIRRSDV